VHTVGRLHFPLLGRHYHVMLLHMVFPGIGSEESYHEFHCFRCRKYLQAERKDAENFDCTCEGKVLTAVLCGRAHSARVSRAPVSNTGTIISHIKYRHQISFSMRSGRMPQHEITRITKLTRAKSRDSPARFDNWSSTPFSFSMTRICHSLIQPDKLIQRIGPLMCHRRGTIK